MPFCPVAGWRRERTEHTTDNETDDNENTNEAPAVIDEGRDHQHAEEHGHDHEHEDGPERAICPCCHEDFVVEDGYDTGDGTVCEACYEYEYVQCEDCGNAVRRRDARQSEGDCYVCDRINPT